MLTFAVRTCHCDFLHTLSFGFVPGVIYLLNSVSLGQNGIGMKVNTAIGSIDFSDVKQLG